MISECGACGAPIRVVATTSCAKLKLDPDPVEDGDVVIGEIAGVEVAVRPDQARVDIHAAGIPMYRMHTRTCAGALRIPVEVDSKVPPGDVQLQRPDGSRTTVLTGVGRERPHPFSRRNSGGKRTEET